MIHFNNAWIIRCYPVSPRTHCTIASISKSITNNNPRWLSGAKCQGREGGGGGRQEWLCFASLVTSSSHTKMPSRISRPGRLCFPSEMLQTPIGAAGGSIPAPNWEWGTRLRREEGSGWGRSIPSLPRSCPAMGISRFEKAGKLILPSM